MGKSVRYFSGTSLLICLLAILIITSVVSTGEAEASSQAHCGHWRVVSSANNGSTYNNLNAVTAIARNDVWAAGYYANSSSGPNQTLIEQWNGKAWSVVSSPNVGSGSNQLLGIAAASASEVWAVGYASNGAPQTLIEHWNGSQWNIVSSPNPGSVASTLSAVGVVSATDAWAVGSYTSGGSSQTLIEHWNGTNWSVVSSPSMSNANNYLTGVGVVSANDVWISGSYYSSQTSTQSTLIEHWNGKKWHIVSSPNVGTYINDLTGIAAVSAHNIWTVGEYLNSNSGQAQTLIERWDGKHWSVVSSPNLPSAYNSLNGVTVLAANNIWSAGYDISSKGVYQTFTEHWNGKKWRIVASPNVGTSGDLLNGVAGILGTNSVWTVGFYNTSVPGSATLTEYYC